MPKLDHALGTYLHLARASELRREMMVRDKLLVLAGVRATEMGLDEISDRCRARVLRRNARHLVRHWPTLGAALEDDEFRYYVRQLRRRYSPERAEHILERLGVELGRERDLYISDHEYATALLGRATSSPAAKRPSLDVAAGRSCDPTPGEVRRPRGRWLACWAAIAGQIASLFSRRDCRSREL
jgi:hypothetical protein